MRLGAKEMRDLKSRASLALIYTMWVQWAHLGPQCTLCSRVGSTIQCSRRQKEKTVVQ
jgi:hypothetical protein